MNHPFKIRFTAIFITIFLVLLSSCKSQEALTPIPSSIVPLSMTATSNTSQRLPLTSTPTITDTTTPTNKPDTKTSIPTITEAPSPTTIHPGLILYSPNKEYFAEFDNAYEHPGQKQKFEIFDKKGSLLWEVPSQEIPTGDPRPELSIHGWSNDSVYFYFLYKFFPDGGDWEFWWDGYDLQRINVQTGAIEKVIKGNGWVAFAFSPDQTQIAYTRDQDNPSIIYIRDLDTGIERTSYVRLATYKYVRIGNIHWSPNGKEIAFQTESDNLKIQTIYLNPNTMIMKLAIEYIYTTLRFDGWAKDGKLQFSAISKNGVYIERVFQIDTTTNETIEVGTPTPRP